MCQNLKSKQCEKKFGSYLIFNSLYTYHMSCLCHIQCHIQRTTGKVTSHKTNLEDSAPSPLLWPKYTQWSYEDWCCPELTLTHESTAILIFFLLLENLYVLSLSLPSVDPTVENNFLISVVRWSKKIKDSTMTSTI